MGHLAGKDIYRRLGTKIDSLTMRAPWNDALHEILRELYTEAEADLIVRMPSSPATFEQIQRRTRTEEAPLRALLERLCDKGLVMDICLRGNYYYLISPMIIGIFEFTMMRTRGQTNHAKCARLFHEYMENNDSFFRANFGSGQRVSVMRALPHEGTIDDTDHVEILDYERAGAIVDAASSRAIGICSCRHERVHLGQKQCDIPLETCLSFDSAADYLTRHGMARAADAAEIRDLMAQSREQGLVFCADNSRTGVSFICQCCGCCCTALRGISQSGYPGIIVTSNYIARCNAAECLACGTCEESCPINAVSLNGGDHPVIDESICLGCGVCALDCETGAMRLAERDRRVLHPEDTFERVILQCLERGTLQDQIFSDPEKLSHSFMRAVVGGFLKLPPVKRALMSDSLRSSFLNALKSRAGA